MSTAEKAEKMDSDPGPGGRLPDGTVEISPAPNQAVESASAPDGSVVSQNAAADSATSGMSDPGSPSGSSQESTSVDVTRRLGPRQVKAIKALLGSPSIASAAKQSGVNEKTIRRWLELHEFNASYLQARRQVYTQAIAVMQRAAPAAVNALLAIITGTAKPLPDGMKYSDVIRSAQILLQFGRHGIDVDELAIRIQSLEDGD